MNRAVAVARVHGPQAGLDALDAITDRSSLESYHLFHAIRGTLAAELGRLAEALTHFRQAGNLASLPAERDFIARRIRDCEERAAVGDASRIALAPVVSILAAKGEVTRVAQREVEAEVLDHSPLPLVDRTEKANGGARRTLIILKSGGAVSNR